MHVGLILDRFDVQMEANIMSKKVPNIYQNKDLFFDRFRELSGGRYRLWLGGGGTNPSPKLLAKSNSDMNKVHGANW